MECTAKVVTPAAEQGAKQRAESPGHPAREPFTLVIFGASGDLAKRKLIPALYQLERGGLLPRDYLVVGFSRTQLTDEHYRSAMKEALTADKLPAGDGSFRGGPAYYIERGLGARRWGMLFAVLLIFTFGIALITGIAAGTVPAWKLATSDPHDALKQGGRTDAASAGKRTRNVLVVVEVARSVILLIGSALTARTFLALQSLDAGIRTDHVLAVPVPLPPVHGEGTAWRHSNDAVTSPSFGRPRFGP